MSKRTLIGGLILLHTSFALGQAIPIEASQAASASAEQTIYKGVVGNVLVGVPMDAERASHICRGKAVRENPSTSLVVTLSRT